MTLCDYVFDYVSYLALRNKIEYQSLLTNKN